ncbi:copper amine oxidase N-terminal domain-containing protein [Alkalihalobacillus oceani]|uniref:copper amine oxidase N-terminal domain-containing protein n=1 Tax=Halalkalibacter oceani TaxID=1653776 RepID=UPI00203A78E2|nr:copper amine oxidase N-terminal domain-containing protein [Halalkalibacter oceani]MCM3762061.1 copper amine oxidase N-terminal domain-containing protein [Halalkalibacter oceani]
MKKVGFNLLLTIALIFSFGQLAAAQDVIKIYLNGERLSVPVAPVIERGSTLVPMRPIFEGLGMKVNWDQSTRTVTGTGNNVTTKLIVGKNKAYVNGAEVNLDVPAKIVNGTTMVPVRFVAESTGWNVTWNGSTRSVMITSPDYAGTTPAPPAPNHADRLYTVNGTGTYAGYLELKGFPDEDKYRIYLKGDANSYTVSIEDVRGINLNEMITWQYAGQTYRTQRRDLHRYFSDKTWYNLGNYDYIHESLENTFGHVYVQWVEGLDFTTNEGPSLVNEYFKQTMPEPPSNITLTPDAKVVVVDTPREERTTEEVIEQIKRNTQKAFEETLSEEDKKFLQEWISERELKEKYQLNLIRTPDSIRFYHSDQVMLTEILFEIKNVPARLDDRVVKQGSGVRYQYVRNDPFGSQGLYFNRNDVKDAGLID